MFFTFVDRLCDNFFFLGGEKECKGWEEKRVGEYFPQLPLQKKKKDIFSGGGCFSFRLGHEWRPVGIRRWRWGKFAAFFFYWCLRLVSNDGLLFRFLLRMPPDVREWLRCPFFCVFVGISFLFCFLSVSIRVRVYCGCWGCAESCGSSGVQIFEACWADGSEVLTAPTSVERCRLFLVGRCGGQKGVTVTLCCFCPKRTLSLSLSLFMERSTARCVCVGDGITGATDRCVHTSFIYTSALVFCWHPFHQ